LLFRTLIGDGKMKIVWMLLLLAMVSSNAIAQEVEVEELPLPGCYETDTSYCHVELPNANQNNCTNTTCVERTVNGATVMVCNWNDVTYAPQAVEVKTAQPQTSGLTGQGNFGTVNCLYKDVCDCLQTTPVGGACKQASQSYPPGGVQNTSTATGVNCPINP
jgi:hypothetical protein